MDKTLEALKVINELKLHLRDKREECKDLQRRVEQLQLAYRSAQKLLAEAYAEKNAAKREAEEFEKDAARARYFCQAYEDELHAYQNATEAMIGTIWQDVEDSDVEDYVRDEIKRFMVEIGEDPSAL